MSTNGCWTSSRSYPAKLTPCLGAVNSCTPHVEALVTWDITLVSRCLGLAWMKLQLLLPAHIYFPSEVLYSWGREGGGRSCCAPSVPAVGLRSGSRLYNLEPFSGKKKLCCASLSPFKYRNVQLYWIFSCKKQQQHYNPFLLKLLTAICLIAAINSKVTSWSSSDSANYMWSKKSKVEALHAATSQRSSPGYMLTAALGFALEQLYSLMSF